MSGMLISKEVERQLRILWNGWVKELRQPITPVVIQPPRITQKANPLLVAYTDSAHAITTLDQVIGTWYRDRTGTEGSYVYDGEITQDVFDPLGMLPDSGEIPTDFEEFQGAALLATINGQLIVIQPEHATAKVTNLVGLFPQLFTDDLTQGCLRSFSSRFDIRTPKYFVIPDSPNETFGGRAKNCGSYTGGEVEPDPSYDPGGNWDYQGSGVWTLASGEDPEDYKPPGYAPNEPPSDWEYHETVDGTPTAYWVSPSTGYFLYLYPV